MQVSHQNDHVTNAVIGGKQAIEFGISNSAEFFNILSSTLYKDQILAVVREVLCNAWDAHIEAGCTDRPVQITLTDTEFTIKDFGKGIHQDDMGLIYGTYGNSTKKNDGNQTGGFGLGCKAPFAYTDHFEVVSSHAGIRTIYNLSKNSAQAMGKPGITPITSFPSDESGLTVKIRIKAQDARRFRELIQRIAYNGDMNMQLDGKQLTTLDFDVSQQNFLLTRECFLDAHPRIMVRYGNVIYPVESSGNEVAFSAICAHLDKLGGTRHPFCIVFQAPPHSIAVTPSRESLSMQEHTVRTLGTLFKGFLDALDTEFKVACLQYSEEIIHEAAKANRVDELLKREEAIPILKRAEVELRIADFNTMAKTYLQNNYPKGLAYRKEDITKRLEIMVQNNLLDRGKVQSFLRELKGVQKECSGIHNWHTIIEKNSWLQRKILAPLLCKLEKNGLPTKQLYTCNPEDSYWQANKQDNSAPLVPATKASPRHLLTTLPYLRNIVVLTTRRADLTERAYKHPVFKAAGGYYGYLVYVVGRKKGEIEAARQFFTQEGMKVADLTLSDAPEREASRPRKAAKKGVAKLSSILNRYGLDTSQSMQEDVERTEHPEFIAQVSTRQGISTRTFGCWSPVNAQRIVRLFGDKGAVTHITATFDRWRGKGVPSLDIYVQEKVCKYLLNNPRIEAHWTNHRSHIGETHHQLLDVIYGNKHLAKEFGLSNNPLTNEDQAYLELWKELMVRCRYSYETVKEMKEVSEWLKSIPPSPAVLALGAKLTSSRLSMLDVGEFQDAITHASPTELPELVTLLKTFFK